MTETSSAVVPASRAFWVGEGIGARSARFTIALMAPIGLAPVIGAGSWIAYAVVTSILCFIVDTGGPARERLLRMAIGGAVILGGAGIGTLAAGHSALVALTLAGTAFIYGLLENAEPSTAFAARFLCLSASIGALFAPVVPGDIAVVALFVAIVWLVSVGWDWLSRTWRPSTEQPLRTVLARMEARRVERWSFAIIVAATVALAFAASLAVGLTRPNWAVFAILVTMRMDAAVSRQTVINLLVGTAVGSVIAAAYVAVFPSATGLVIGMTLAALLRWPSHQLHTALGLAAMAAFIILLIELAASMAGLPTHAPVDRLIDISLGCVFAIGGLVVNGLLQSALHRMQRRGG